MIELAVLPFSLIGFAVSFFIYHKKHRKREKLVCIIGDDCDRVIHSDYSKLFGIHLEILGIIYYSGFSVLVVLLRLGLYEMLGFPLFETVIVLSTAAFVFSVFLIYVQTFVLREYCEYCLVSALMSTVIFLIEIF